MKLSILPVFIVAVFAFCLLITKRAQKNQAITAKEASAVYLLLALFGLWALVSIIMGMKQLHVPLMDQIPLLWQACVAVVVASIGLLSKDFRNALRGIADATPGHWLIFIQALRIGALGVIVKTLRGEITSLYPFWIGIPDFLFGLSALLVGWLFLRKSVSNGFLIAWNLLGAAIILVPTFLAMPYWMSEPGFSFIFEFPMILAPVPLFPFSF